MKNETLNEPYTNYRSTNLTQVRQPYQKTTVNRYDRWFSGRLSGDDNPIVRQLQSNMPETLTPEARMERMLTDAKVLSVEKPALLVKAAKEISCEAEAVSSTMLGENHPLADFLKKIPDEEAIRSLEEGMAQAREMLEQLERANP